MDQWFNRKLYWHSEQKEKSFLNTPPAVYATNSFTLAKGGCVDFLSSSTKTDNTKKRERDDVIECESFDSKDEWGKKVRNNVLIIGKKQKQIGVYQASADVDMAMLNQPGKPIGILYIH
jgi:hypothetical protein